MRFLISAVVVAVLAGFVVSAADAKVLIYCSEGSPEGFDPARFITGTTFDASSQTLYNRLVEFEPGTTRVVPALAESFEVSPDGLQYTFHLRAGVKFHSTMYFTPKRDLNADDVVFSLNRQRDRKNPYFNYAGGIWPFYDSMEMDSLVKSIVKVDDLTVKITLTHADAGLLADLAMDFASILSKEYADSLIKPDTREQLNQRPIGTGPYQFVAYEPGARIAYEANANYWRGAQKLDHLIFQITPGAATRLAKLKVGLCQVSAEPDAASLKSAKSDANLTVAQAERLDVAFLAFNTTQVPFNDPRVRKALGMAIDRQAIVDGVYGGDASTAKGVVPATMWGADVSLGSDAHDVEGAKALLAEAGVSGLKVRLLTAKGPRPYSPDPVRTATMIAADFAKVGVNGEVVTPAMIGDYFRQSSAKDRDGAVLIGWTSDNGDPDNFLSLLLSCEAVGASNRAQWCDPGFNDLLKQARAASDPAERVRLYDEAAKVIADQAPLTAIAHTLVSVPMAKSVTGYKVDPLGHHNFEGVDLAP